MSWLDLLRQTLDEILHPRRVDEDLDEELRDHLAREVAREAVRDARAGRLLRDALDDLKIAARTVRRQPAFSLAVVLSLALGVGGTTAVFGIVHAVLLRPLSYADADRLFLLRIWWNDFSASLSPADLLAVGDQSGGIASSGAYFLPNDGFAMATPSGPVVVNGAIITADLPDVLGIAPIAGPVFPPFPTRRRRSSARVCGASATAPARAQSAAASSSTAMPTRSWASCRLASTCLDNGTERRGTRSGAG